MPFIPKIKKAKRKRVEKDRFKDDFSKFIRKQRNTALYINTMKNYHKLHPLCERCGENDIYTLSEEVHHIKPLHTLRGFDLEEVLFYIYDDSNLLAVCKSCHREIHRELK